MKIRGHCAECAPFRTKDAAAGDTAEAVMVLFERCATGKSLGISGGFWQLCLATLDGKRSGNPLARSYKFDDPAAVAATDEDGVLNVWVERVVPAAAPAPAAPAASAGSAAGLEIAAIADAVAARLRKPLSVDMSKPPSTVFEAVRAKAGLAMQAEHMQPPLPLLPFTAYNWFPRGRAELKEEQAADGDPSPGGYPSLLQHLARQLPRELVTACTLNDVRKKAKLRLLVATVEGQYDIKGYSDACLTLSKYSHPSDLFGCGVALIDWKTRTTLFDKTVPKQLLLQSLAFKAALRRVVPVAATDCLTTFRVFLLRKGAFVELLPPLAEGNDGYFPLAEGFSVFCDILARVLPAVDAFVQQQHLPAVPEDDDSNDGDDSDTDGAAGGHGAGSSNPSSFEQRGAASGTRPTPSSGTQRGGSAVLSHGSRSLGEVSANINDLQLYRELAAEQTKQRALQRFRNLVARLPPHLAENS